MNEDRRPVSGEAVDTSPSVDEACEGKPVPVGAGAPEEEAPGGPDPEESGPAAEPGPAAELEDGAMESAAGSGPDADAGGEPVSEPAGEPDEAPGESEEAVATVESLRAQLDEARGEAHEEREAALRARAEAENVRRRAARDVEQARRFGSEGLVGALLPVRDGLELGIQAAKEKGSTVEALAEGTEMTLRMLTAALEKFGAVEVDPEGEDFDPRFHQAMSTQEAEGVASGKVLQVFQKGCLLHGRVVRPAMVIVSR